MAEPYRILLVKVHQMLYPITEEVLHQVFSPHGLVDKIVIFQKSSGFKALIQYQSQHSAFSAIISLQGRNIYDGCCQLDIQFSNLGELQENSALGNEENLKNQFLEDTQVNVKKISQTVDLESEMMDVETWSVINGNKEVLIGEHSDGDKDLVVEEHHLLVESSKVHSSRNAEDECSSYVGETNSALGIDKNGLLSFNENHTTVEADYDNESNDGMTNTQNLQADISLETKLIKPNEIFYLAVMKSQDEAEPCSGDGETNRYELFLEPRGENNCSNSIVETSHIELDNQVRILIRHPKLLYHVLELASSISLYGDSLSMNEDCWYLLEEFADFRDQFSTTKVDTSFTFLFDDVYKNHVAVDMRKIRCLAFVDVDSRGINLKPERELINWIEHRDSEKNIKVEISKNLQKLIRVGDNACNSSYGPFKVSWFRSSKMLLVILEEEDCSRAVSGDLGLVFSHPTRWDYGCMLYNEEQITKKWHCEEGLDKLQKIGVLTYLSLAEIESSIKGFMGDKSNGQGNSTLVPLHLQCINQTTHKDVEAIHMMLFAQSGTNIGDFVSVGVNESSSTTKNVTILDGTMENMVIDCIFSTLTNLRTDLSCFVFVVLEVALCERPIEDDIIVIIGWDWDLIVTNDSLQATQVLIPLHNSTSNLVKYMTKQGHDDLGEIYSLKIVWSVATIPIGKFQHYRACRSHFPWDPGGGEVPKSSILETRIV